MQPNKRSIISGGELSRYTLLKSVVDSQPHESEKHSLKSNLSPFWPLKIFVLKAESV